ncbi:MAG: hypothetical protein U0174_09065 [Polyangiaceae bacterium]
MRSRAPLLCLAGIACGRAVVPSAEVSPDAGALVLVPPAVTAQDAAVTAPRRPKRTFSELEPRLGFHAPLKTHVLYSWTTEEQLALLRQGAPVLQRSFSPGKGFAAFDHALYEAVVAGDTHAKLLWHEGFAKSRFAWSNAFGASASLRGESYGTVLLRITLKPEATFQEFTIEQESAVWPLGHDPGPAQLGAVRFVTRKYREYVIPNESMIERVEAFTPSLRDDLEEQIDFLRSIAASEPPIAAHLLSTLFPERERLPGPDFIKAAIAALETVVKSQATPFERSVSASFTLGAARPSMDVLCARANVTKKTTRLSTFGEQTFFVPTCTSRSKSECTPVDGATKEKAACRILPEFLQ